LSTKPRHAVCVCVCSGGGWVCVCYGGMRWPPTLKPKAKVKLIGKGGIDLYTST
jgi:hypothetical protein